MNFALILGMHESFVKVKFGAIHVSLFLQPWHIDELLWNSAFGSTLGAVCGD